MPDSARSTPRLLALAGSVRRDSFNRRLMEVAARAAEAAGLEVTRLDLAALPLPLLDQDLEARDGLPENARKIKTLMKEHAGFLIAAPEYNSSITPLLKNTIDWASRPEPGEPPLACYRGKLAAIMSASPGGLGGLRGLTHVRDILGNIGVLVIPDQVTIPVAHKAFAEDGSLVDPATAEKVAKMVQRLCDLARATAGS